MSWYKSFFEKWYFKMPHALIFDSSYIKKEVTFIKKILDLPKGSKILDLCCGHGRHLIPLIKNGYRMTGLELSEKSLAILKMNIKRENLKARIIKGDMRNIPFKNEFDAVINMFMSFGYLETDKEDFKVLKSIADSLKPNGKFLIDILNPNYFLANFKTTSEEKKGKLIFHEKISYNSKTKRVVFNVQIIDGDNKCHKTNFKLRVYTLSEMKKVLNRAGFKIIKTYGSTTKLKKYDLNESERIVILAEKNKTT